MLKQRQKMIEDAVRLRKPERVPHLTNIYGWAVHDSGYTLSQALADFSIMEKCQRNLLEKYKFDQVIPFFQVMCNPIGMLEKIGPGYHLINDEVGSINYTDPHLLETHEYEEFLNNPQKYIWEVLLPRKYPAWKDLNSADIVQMFTRYRDYKSLLGRVNKAFEEFEIPRRCNTYIDRFGLEMLGQLFSGIKGLSIDMRRHPADIERFIEGWDEYAGISKAIDGLTGANRENSTAAFDVWLSPMMTHNFLNPKQWERFYWPLLKKVLDKVVEEDLTVYLFVEGSAARMYDYLREYEPGHIVLHVEQDDLFEVRKNLPNCCICGGMTPQVLGGESKEKCVSYAKFLIDELGHDGGFILSQSKMLSYPQDANPENLKAVCDFAQEYYL